MVMEYERKIMKNKGIKFFLFDKLFKLLTINATIQIFF